MATNHSRAARKNTNSRVSSGYGGNGAQGASGIACGGSASGSGGRRGATGARDSVLPKQDQALAGREGGVNVGSDLAASVNGRKAYTGPGRKLIMGFDVGTTYSGVAYSILENGKVPEIRTVTRFPGQEGSQQSKIPTVIYYDHQGAPRAIGAEALQPGVLHEAENEGWVKAEWFKLHLRPKDLTPEIHDDSIPPLPPNKTVVDVFGDFLRFLHRCARTYIRETSGVEFPDQDTHFVLSHPNGWRGYQQSQMRRAAISAGLIPDNQDGDSRLLFISEGEACLHSCLAEIFASQWIKSGKGVVVIDAGGGTVDMSAYRLNVSQSIFEEIAPSECLLQGSTYVTRRAKKFLQGKLEGSLYADPDRINDIVECFDTRMKRYFRNPGEDCFIKFGTLRDNDPPFGISNGQLRVSGRDVASFFEPSVRAILGAIEKQLRVARPSVTAVLLVGGFAANNWLYSNLEAHLERRNITFCRPDDQINKAVAHGALSFYLDHLVRVRIAPFTYGISCAVTYDSTNPRHVARQREAQMDAKGGMRLHRLFDAVVSRGTPVAERTEFFRDYTWIGARQPLDISEQILYYSGTSSMPEWIDDEKEAFKTLCTVKADASNLMKGLVPSHGPLGAYYVLRFRIILQFGLTELKAQIGWTEDGEEKRSRAVIVYPGEMDEHYAS